jgi:hypothetical protein
MKKMNEELKKDRNFHEVIDKIINIVEFNITKDQPNFWLSNLRELKRKHLFTPKEIKSSWVDLGNFLSYHLNSYTDEWTWEWEIFYLIQDIEMEDNKKYYGKLTGTKIEKE